jgi:hypothetical protein
MVKNWKTRKNSFKLQILRLKTRAYRKLGIEGGEFLQLTPFELYTLERELYDEDQQTKEYDFQKWKLENTMHDRRCARIQAAIYNNNANRKRNSKSWEEDDFMPKPAKAKEKLDSSEIAARMKHVTNTINSVNKNRQKFVKSKE